MAGYICSYIIALIAVAAGGFCMIYPFYHKIVCKMPTTATVIDIQERWSRHSDDTRDHLVYYPVFQYWANGEMITIEHNVSPSPYQVGDQVEMLYNAELYSRFGRRKLGVSVRWGIVFFDGIRVCCIADKNMAVTNYFGKVMQVCTTEFLKNQTQY